MNLPIKHQLCQIVSQLAYKTFGFNLILKSHQAQLINPNPLSSNNPISFKLPIPHLIYQEYSKDGFMYSDAGATPKQIADDILVHFKQLNHVEMESDQFGNIRAIVKQEYFSQQYDKMIGENKITCMDCEQLTFHRNQTLRKETIVDGSLKELLILFRKKHQYINLSELRQKFMFESIENISHQVFNRKTQIFQHFEDYDSHLNVKSSLSSKKYSQIVFGCLRHQIIQKQNILMTIFDEQSKPSLLNMTKALKFGIAIPESIKLSYPIKDIQKQQISKLRKIFYDFDPQRPINLLKQDFIDMQFKSKLHKKEISLPPTIQHLLFTTEQLLSEMKITKIYHLYLLLSQFLKTKNVQNQLSNSSSADKVKYINAAKIIKDHLGKILCFQ